MGDQVPSILRSCARSLKEGGLPLLPPSESGPANPAASWSTDSMSHTPFGSCHITPRRAVSGVSVGGPAQCHLTLSTQVGGTCAVLGSAMAMADSIHTIMLPTPFMRRCRRWKGSGGVQQKATPELDRLRILYDN